MGVRTDTATAMSSARLRPVVHVILESVAASLVEARAGGCEEHDCRLAASNVVGFAPPQNKTRDVLLNGDDVTNDFHVCNTKPKTNHDTSTIVYSPNSFSV